MSEFEAELAEIFRDEAVGRLDQMDAALLAIESGEEAAGQVDSLFRNAHTIKGSAGMVGFDDVQALAHAVEDVLASIRDAGVFPAEAATPLLRATAVLRAQVTGAAGASDSELLGDLAAARTLVSERQAGEGDSGRLAPVSPPAASPSAAQHRPAPSSVGEALVLPPGQAPIPLPAASPDDAAPEFGRRGAGANEAGQGGPGSRSQRRPLRVPAEKIDQLLDIVGELVQFRGQLGHALGGETELSQPAADLLSNGERMLDELKETAIGMRTLPLAAITGRLPRAVRDLARMAGKEVEFVVTGTETELDRVVIESLYEPLAHLLRNAVMHGIEAPAEREQAGKPARGRLELRAEPRGSLVEIVVADDGRGVSRDVAEQARGTGSLADVLAAPGYSTAAEVTDLAGRGVGLDAVKIYAQGLGGSLEVRSDPGRGLAVVLMLPLAIALLEVLLLERGDAVYGVPLVVVEEVVIADQALMLEGRPALDVRGRPVPVADIAELIGAAAPPPGDRPPALVISSGGRRIVATCDSVLGAEEVVVKPLGPLHGGNRSYLGSAILGDGRIALLLEPAGLTMAAQKTPVTTAREAAQAPADPSDADPAEPAKILVAEDSFTVRELQRSILEAAGYSVVTAGDGREALAAIGRDSQIALVVSDLEMPELDGLGLTRAIRADRERSSLPVIIVTSRGSAEDRQRGVDAGADAYVAKQSFDQHALLAIVERLLGR